MHSHTVFWRSIGDIFGEVYMKDRGFFWLFDVFNYSNVGFDFKRWVEMAMNIINF